MFLAVSINFAEISFQRTSPFLWFLAVMDEGLSVVFTAQSFFTTRLLGNDKMFEGKGVF
jgi:hypothetical protein